MSEERQQDLLDKDSVRNGNENVQNQNEDHATPDINSVHQDGGLQQRHVNESADVLIIEQPEGRCQRHNTGKKKGTGVVHGHPNEFDKKYDGQFPQVHFDNAKNLPPFQQADKVCIEDIQTPSRISGSQKVKQAKVRHGIKQEKNKLQTGVGKTTRGSEITKHNDDDKRISEFKGDKTSVIVAPQMIKNPHVTVTMKNEHQTNLSNSWKKNVKCPDYNSDEFADVEDNLLDSASDNAESSNGEAVKSKNAELKNTSASAKAKSNKKDKPEVLDDLEKIDADTSANPEYGLVGNKKPRDKFEYDISAPSCSYSSESQSKRPNTYPEVHKKTAMKTMSTIMETPEQAGGNVKADTQLSVSKTNPLKVKSKVGNKPNKCNMCNARLGLCAIRCRCGGYYCARHRYDKEHNCAFDYKSMGAEEIRKNNPRVVAEKIRKL